MIVGTYSPAESLPSWNHSMADWLFLLFQLCKTGEDVYVLIQMESEVADSRDLFLSEYI